MYYKVCPFCGLGVKEQLRGNTYVIDHRCKSGLQIFLTDKSVEGLQTKWNSRFIDAVKDKEVGKSNYGYLLMPNGDVVKCDDSHPEELLAYLDIYNDYEEFDYEELCMTSGIIRVSEHCNCLSIDLPNITNKTQSDKLFEVLNNYIGIKKFIVKYKEVVTEINSISDLMLYLDKLI